MQKDRPHFLRISGKINPSNKREFQQTVQFLFNHLQAECMEKHLSLDVNITNLYHLYFLWASKDALHQFKTSYDFELLNGAWQTLGSLKEIQSGGTKYLQLFETNQLDT